MKNKLQLLIKTNGCDVRSELFLKEKNFNLWIEAQFRGAFGLFSPKICTKSIILFVQCPNDSTEYVLAHEFGHFISFQHGFGIHKLFKEDVKLAMSSTIRHLIMEEEFRADMFAIMLAQRMWFVIPDFVKNNRIPDYNIIPETRKNELMNEVHQMINSISSSLESAA